MRAVACAAALAAVAPLVGSSALSDEVALLQRKAQGQADDDVGFELHCDELKGCFYHVHTSSTPAPYKLICDDEVGCRYTGLARPTVQKSAPPLLSQGMTEGLQLLINSVGGNVLKAAKPPPKEAKPAIPELLEKIKNSDLPAMVKDLDIPGELLQKLKPPAWLKNMQLPGQSLQASVAEGGPVAHFIPDNLMCCVQGPPDYLREKLAKLKASPIGAGYVSAEVVDGSCQSQSYGQGPAPETCFPKASLWMSREHPVDVTSEPKMLAAFAAKHGILETGKGMKELCAP